LLSRCAVDGHDIGALAVMVAYRYHGKPTVAEYASFETKARATRRGLWSSQFDEPRQFRKNKDD
jgi:endonuclease YncB( thermonuclease family)